MILLQGTSPIPPYSIVTPKKETAVHEASRGVLERTVQSGCVCCSPVIGGNFRGLLRTALLVTLSELKKQSSHVSTACHAPTQVHNHRGKKYPSSCGLSFSTRRGSVSAKGERKLPCHIRFFCIRASTVLHGAEPNHVSHVKRLRKRSVLSTLFISPTFVVRQP